MTSKTTVPKILLLLVGVAGLGLSAVYCFFWVVGSMMGGSFGASIGTPNVLDYALVFAPMITFASYIWIALRPWRYSALVVWGILAHLPFLRFLPAAQDHLQVFVIVLFLIFAALVYTCFVWSRGKQSDPEGSAQESAR